METPVETTAAQAWSHTSDRLRETLSASTFETFFASARPGVLTSDEFVLVFPNEFARNWVERDFGNLVRTAVREAVGPEREVTLAFSQEPEPDEIQPGTQAGDGARRSEQRPRSAKYTFDNFIMGSSNRFAHAAALTVAESPAQAYNPLFIYGSTGLGKTHLLHAIAAYVNEHSQGLTTRYVTSEAFMNDFINALRDKRVDGFKHRYRAHDVLLIDDVQFLEGKERFQEEFFHTFNSLYEAGRQIVLSSDRPPKEIKTLEDRLRSRFEWGLITDIQPPDLETRIAILRKKVANDAIEVADPEVLTFIAGRVTTNIRELEGALTRVVAFSSLTGLPVDSLLAEQVLSRLFPGGGDLLDVTIARIQEVVADAFGLSVGELCGQRRSQDVTYPRHLAMYLSRELTDSSLPKIGKEFGGRDHTTVLHANAKITRMINEDRRVYNLVEDLTAKLKVRG